MRDRIKSIFKISRSNAPKTANEIGRAGSFARAVAEKIAAAKKSPPKPQARGRTRGALRSRRKRRAAGRIGRMPESRRKKPAEAAGARANARRIAQQAQKTRRRAYRAHARKPAKKARRSRRRAGERAAHCAAGAKDAPPGVSGACPKAGEKRSCLRGRGN